MAPAMSMAIQILFEMPSVWAARHGHEPLLDQAVDRLAVHPEAGQVRVDLATCPAWR